MTDHPGDQAKIEAQKSDKIADGQHYAGDSLRHEFMSEIAPRTRSNSNVALEPAEQRKAEETEMFRDRFKSQNIELDAPHPGWGPFQILEQMVKDKKINLSPDEVLDESRRIRDRDFKEMGRKYYSKDDHIKRWTEMDIENKVHDTVSRVKGIDVSNHNGEIDWKKVKEAGYQFAFLKATEGIDWVDATFAKNRQAARDAGLSVGYYHYYRPNDTVDEQVANFVKTVGKAEPNMLRLVIDAEDEKIWKPYPLEQRVKMIDEWCQKVQKELGVTPQITVYGSPNFFNGMLQNAPQLAKYDLWIANYNVAEPTVPKPWSNWAFWQYTEKGKVPGINGDVDINMYNGTNLNVTPKSKTRH